MVAGEDAVKEAGSRPAERKAAPGPGEGLFCRDLPTKPRPEMGVVLVTGGSGYIGGRLVPELLARGYRVRVMVRRASPEQEARWRGAEIAAGDALDPGSLERALEGVHAAYYLIHSMALGPGSFAEADIQSAVNFRKAAAKKGAGRIIYLGGLGDEEALLSEHLRSRLEVAEELERGPVPVTILRAAVIIGSGSASYEILLHLVKNLPFFLIPPWAKNLCQPIGIRDVIKYLVGVLEIQRTAGRRFDIGGRDVITYRRMMEILAKILRRKRLFIPFPLWSVGFYSYLASLFTPVPAPIIHCLMSGLKNDVFCRDRSIGEFLPFEPLSYKEAVVRALTREEQDRVHTRWSDAYPPAHELAIKLHELAEPPRFTTTFSIHTDKSAPSLFRSICRVGGREGWFHNNWMWRLRGMVDRLLLGVGTSRGRRSRSTLAVNDVVDFWRVEDLKENRRLLLRAEMKLPGLAWLEFALAPEDGGNRLFVTAYYDTRTLFGKAYWYAFLPFHEYIFRDLIRQIAKRS